MFGFYPVAWVLDQDLQDFEDFLVLGVGWDDARCSF
jgi:hypothetical protein